MSFLMAVSFSCRVLLVGGVCSERYAAFKHQVYDSLQLLKQRFHFHLYVLPPSLFSLLSNRILVSLSPVVLCWAVLCCAVPCSINAEGPIAEVKQRIINELKYQSSMELSDDTLSVVRQIPLATDLTAHGMWCVLLVACKCTSLHTTEQQRVEMCECVV